MLSEFDFGMITGGASAIVALLVVTLFLKHRGAFDGVKVADPDMTDPDSGKMSIAGKILLGRLLVGSMTVLIGVCILASALIGDGVEPPQIAMLCGGACCTCLLTMIYSSTLRDQEKKKRSLRLGRGFPDPVPYGNGPLYKTKTAVSY